MRDAPGDWEGEALRRPAPSRRWGSAALWATGEEGGERRPSTARADLASRGRAGLWATEGGLAGEREAGAKAILVFVGR